MVTAMFFGLWIAANFTYITALAYLEAGVVTALFNTAPVWVVILSYVLLGPGDRPSSALIAVLSALLAVGGATLVVLSSLKTGAGSTEQHSKPKIRGTHALIGCIASLVSALAAAVYKVLYRRWFGASSTRFAFLVLGSVGAGMLIFGAPISALVLGTGWQSVDWSVFPWGLQILACFGGMSFNLSVAVGVATTYPLYVAVGTILGLPLNVIVDVVFRGTTVNWVEILGMVAVGCGFMLLSMADFILGCCSGGKNGSGNEETDA